MERLTQLLNVIRMFPNMLILYTASLHIGWGAMFIVLDELPLPFAGIQWYADNGGQFVWGPLFIVAGLTAVASIFNKDRNIKLALIAPSLLVVFLGAYGMAELLITSFSTRLLIGSGYVMPHALWLGVSVALNYGLPHPTYNFTIKQFGDVFNGSNQ